MSLLLLALLMTWAACDKQFPSNNTHPWNEAHGELRNLRGQGLSSGLKTAGLSLLQGLEQHSVKMEVVTCQQRGFPTMGKQRVSPRLAS